MMNVLVMGDEHTYGYGLSGGKLSYIGHFIRQISRAGQSVSVEAYAHLTIPQMLTTLAQLPLNRYDLIILQLDERLCESSGQMEATTMAKRMSPVLPHLTENFRPSLSGLASRLKAFKAAALSYVRPARARMLMSLLKTLRPYRHNVLIVTPFPVREWLSHWIRQRNRAILLDEADEQLFSVFDSDSIIEPREEYFLANDPWHLNAISHEMLGRSLFDFYLSAPTIVTVQTIKREKS